MNESRPEPSLGADPPGHADPSWPDPWASPPATATDPRPVIHRARGGTLRVVVPAAVLSAVIGSGLTLAFVGVTAPRAAAPAVATATPATPTVTLASSTAVDAVERVAAAASPSVVTITTSGSAGLSPLQVPSSGVGSGIVVSADGLILTNAHVVEGARSLSVALADGTEVAGTVVARDAEHDLAVVRAEATGLTPAPLAASDDLVVGQAVVAIGSPLGTFTDTVTLGIVSGLGRDVDVADAALGSVRHLSGLIQTDAAINPGNSGGPLLDAAGRVVGIVTANATDAQGVGFAVPISVARALLATAST